MKKTISLLLALILTLALAVPAFAAVGFTDVPATHWAYADITACAEAGIVTGYADGSFHPGDNVTTVQFLVMLTRTFHADKLSQVVTPAGQPWYYANLKVAEDTILSNGLIVEDTPMDRYSMAQALYNEIAYVHILNIAAGEQGILDSADTLAAKTALKDWDNMTLKQKTWVKYCYALGILSGMSDGTFSGEANMTRAQACAVIVRMMNLINGSTPAAPAQPTTPTQPTTPVQPQQPEPPTVTGTGKLANGQPATVENVHAILEEIKKEYPSETVWGPPNIPNNNYYKDGPLNDNETNRDVVVLNNNFKSDSSNGRSRTSLVYGCGGWACMVSERIFGKTGAPCREVKSASELRPGDIVYSMNKNNQVTHVSIVYEIDIQDDGVIHWRTCDGNIHDAEKVGVVSWSEYMPNTSYPKTTELGKENATKFGSYHLAFTRYPD